MVAPLGGRLLKGSDYLWAAYRRWMDDDPAGLSPAGQAALEASVFDRRLRDDEGRQPLPEARLYLDAARSYGTDMIALDLTPAVWSGVPRRRRRPRPRSWCSSTMSGGYKEDPLRKKSALLALILRERPEGFLPEAGDDVPPIVDYHVQRSLLRLGILRVEDEALAARLVARRLLEPGDEQAVRRAGFRAMSRLRDESGRWHGRVRLLPLPDAPPLPGDARARVRALSSRSRLRPPQGALPAGVPHDLLLSQRPSSRITFSGSSCGTRETDSRSASPPSRPRETRMSGPPERANSYGWRTRKPPLIG